MLNSQKTATLLPLTKAKADFDNGVYDARWKKNPWLKIRGSLNKAPKVLEVLAEHREMFDYEPVCDVDELDYLAEPFLKNRCAPHGCGFSQFSSFYVWWSNCRSFFAVASGRRDAHTMLTAQSDDWSELSAHLTGRRGAPVVFNKYDMVGVNSLVRESRQRGVSIADLTQDTVLEIVESVPSTTGASVVKGIQLLNCLRGDNRVPAEYLPPNHIDDQLFIISDNNRRVPPIHPNFLSAMEDHIERKRTGSTQATFGTECRTIKVPSVKTETVKNISVALRWYWHGLCSLGHADITSEFDAACMTDPVLLHDVVESCSEGRLGPVCDPVSRRAMVRMVVDFLDSIEPGYRQKIDPKFFTSESLRLQKGFVSADEIRKQTECLRFIRDPSYQFKFFTMPTFFYEQAKPMIENFDGLFQIDEKGHKRVSKDQHRALDLAIMAALTVIITRFPARLSTLNKLRLKGSQPHTIFPNRTDTFNHLTLNITADITKNDRSVFQLPLTASDTVNPLEILKWFAEIARPLVMKYKPTDFSHVKPASLFCGLHIETLRRIWNSCTQEIDIPITAHMSRHLCASLLYHQGVSGQDIAQLLLISREVVEKTYTFVDRQASTQTIMDAQARIFREIGA